MKILTIGVLLISLFNVTSMAMGAEMKKTFAIVYPVVHPFFEPVTASAKKHAKEKGINIITRAPESANVAQQIEIIKKLVAQKVDGIALCATDPNIMTPYLNKAMEAGIPVIAFESDMPKSKRACFMGTDNYRAGEHLAHVLARELNYEGKSIICTGLSTQRSLNERLRGIKDTLKANYPKVKIVSLQTGQGDPALTLNVIKTQIKEFPDFDAFTSIDATGGPAAVSIWRAKGWKAKDHKIITFDNMNENLKGVKEGIVTAVITQRQWTWGSKIVDRLSDVIAKKPVVNFDDTGTVEITSKNVDSYQKETSWDGKTPWRKSAE